MKNGTRLAFRLAISLCILSAFEGSTQASQRNYTTKQIKNALPPRLHGFESVSGADQWVDDQTPEGRKGREERVRAMEVQRQEWSQGTPDGEELRQTLQKFRFPSEGSESKDPRSKKLSPKETSFKKYVSHLFRQAK